jgi:hypothetical protein
MPARPLARSIVAHTTTRPLLSSVASAPLVQKIFFAVQDPLVGGVVQARRRLDIGGIGTGLRLGHRHGAPLGRALGEPAHEAFLLLGRADGVDCCAAQGARGGAQVDAGITPRQRLDHVDHLDVLDRRLFGLVFPLGRAAVAIPIPIGTRCARQGAALHLLHERPDELDVFHRSLVFVLVVIA